MNPSAGRAILDDRLAEMREKLRAHGQEHVLRFVDEITASDRADLLDTLARLDFVAIDEMIESYVRNRPKAALPKDIEPAPYYDHAMQAGAEGSKYREIGADLIRSGKVAAFTVAGGQGTRLGWSGPKGTYPATVITGKPLFRVFAEQIAANQKKYSVVIPWYIMTSEGNDADTRAFFQDNNCFGLARKNVFMFPQGMLPSFDAATGRLLLAEKGRLAMNPDGHGGSIKALRTSGAIEDMRIRGIEHISYFQVDNPLVKVMDPLFIGLHAAAPDSSGEMSSKMVAKAYAEEKVGVFCKVDGKTAVIEYSDLPAELAGQRSANGGLRFNAGSIAIHLISVKLVERLTADAHHFALPYHRADKKVAHVDLETGRVTEPSSPNGVKLETFVFDALPLAESSIVMETLRVEEFAPIKNADGVDSPATSHQIQSDRNGAWLESRSVKVARLADGHVDAKIEIGPLTALEPADLAGVELPREVEPGAELVL